MISFDLRVTNPFSTRWNILLTRSKLLGKKAVELNAYKSNVIFEAALDISMRCDHAGFRVSLGFIGYEIELHFYDTRHWDNEIESWKDYK